MQPSHALQVVAVALAKFIAHLVNQQVAHEILALQMLTLLLEKPTDDSVEVSAAGAQVAVNSHRS